MEVYLAFRVGIYFQNAKNSLSTGVGWDTQHQWATGLPACGVLT